MLCANKDETPKMVSWQAAKRTPSKFQISAPRCGSRGEATVVILKRMHARQFRVVNRKGQVIGDIGNNTALLPD